MCFSHAKGHMSISYISCIKFHINQYVENLYLSFSFFNTEIDKKKN
jgi:hypothetical protein